MVDHYPEEQMPEPDKPVEYDTESDPDKCKVRVHELFWFAFGFSKIYSQLPRCSTAWGTDIGFSLVGPTKVKACKSFIFTESSHRV